MVPHGNSRTAPDNAAIFMIVRLAAACPLLGRGIVLPICASCKKIRDDQGDWNQLESYIGDHSEADFNLGICPDWVNIRYPGFLGKGAIPDP